MKTWISLFVVVALSGCGTINTTFSHDAVAANKLGRWKSNCDYIPRVYSGVSLDYCALDAEQRAFKSNEIRPSAGLIVVDMALSGVADTLVLPYSLYLQSDRGNIKKTRFSE